MQTIFRKPALLGPSICSRPQQPNWTPCFFMSWPCPCLCLHPSRSTHTNKKKTGILTLYQLWLFWKDKIKEKIKLVREETVGMARVFLIPEGRLHRQQRVDKERNPNAAECFPYGCLGGAPLSQDSSRRKAQGAVHAGSSAALGWQAVAAPARAQLEGSWRPHHKVLLMGEGMHGRHPRPSPQWALTRSKVQMETKPAFRSKSAPL